MALSQDRVSLLDRCGRAITVARVRARGHGDSWSGRSASEIREIH